MRLAAASDATPAAGSWMLMEAYAVPTVPEIIVRMRDAVPEGGWDLDDAELRNPCEMTQALLAAKPPSARNETLARQLDDMRRNAAQLSNYVLPDIRVCVAASPGRNVPRPVQTTDPPSEPAQGRGRLLGGKMRGGDLRSYIMAGEPG
jgi:hypothetical protein